MCNEIHTKVLNQWGTLSCDCGLVPKLQLSQTPRNKNKVFLGCPKPWEARCGYFQWINQAPNPIMSPRQLPDQRWKNDWMIWSVKEWNVEKDRKQREDFSFHVYWVIVLNHVWLRDVVVLCYVTAHTCPLSGDFYWILPNTLGMWLTSS